VTRIEAGLGADVRALVERVGSPLAEAHTLTRLPSPVMAHASFRLAFANGRVVKARRVETAAQAERMHAILDALDARHFPRVLDRQGAALLEEWIPGEPMEPPVAPALTARCGAVLGAMHRTVPPDGIGGSPADAAQRLDQLERQAGGLVRLGVLASGAAARLLAIARAHVPEDIDVGLIHRDFCAENIVLAGPEHPWVVDNETVRIDACDFDLARTWYRWPMTAAEETAFLDGYAAHRRPDAFLASFPFWALCALVDTALFRQRARTPRASVPLDRLEALLRDPTSGRPGRHGSPASGPSERAGSAPARGYRYPGLTIRVESPEPAHLAWLDEFLTPAFARADGAAWDRRVTLDADRARHAETLARGPCPSGARPVCFVLDGRAVAHPEWQAGGPERIVFDQSYRAFYCVRPGGGDVRVLTDGGVARSRVALMRVVREVAMGASVEGGALLLHAAAFAAGERGIVLAGPKGCGKTTLLLHALAAGKTRFVSNDRVVVRVDDDGDALARGLPTMVAVQPGTLAMFPDVAARVRPFRHHLTIAEAAAAALPARPARAASLTPAQLCDALGVSAQAEARLWRIVFPCVDPDGNGIRLEPLDRAGATRRLTAALFGAGAPGRVSEVFSPRGGHGVIGPAALHGICEELAARVPCFVARVGPRGCAEPDVTRALLEP
jgi:Ser/Thr protein kinase RdoA (MazF antagonist)